MGKSSKAVKMIYESSKTPGRDQVTILSDFDVQTLLAIYPVIVIQARANIYWLRQIRCWEYSHLLCCSFAVCAHELVHCLAHWTNRFASLLPRSFFFLIFCYSREEANKKNVVKRYERFGLVMHAPSPSLSTPCQWTFLIKLLANVIFYRHRQSATGEKKIFLFLEFLSRFIFVSDLCSLSELCFHFSRSLLAGIAWHVDDNNENKHQGIANLILLRLTKCEKVKVSKAMLVDRNHDKIKWKKKVGKKYQQREKSCNPKTDNIKEIWKIPCRFLFLSFLRLCSSFVVG